MSIILESDDKKKKIMKYILYFGILAFIWITYLIINNLIDGRQFQQAGIIKDDFSFVYQVDELNINGGNIELDGWAFKLDADSADTKYDIALYDAQEKMKYLLYTVVTERSDINNYFKCERDYSHSGFKATIKSSNLDLDKTSYEVLIRFNESDSFYATGTYITGSQLYYTNPVEYVQLEVAGTYLEEIVKNGVIRVSRPDYGMYVYQYDGSLYWIADDTFNFDNSGETYIQYQLDTTQIEKLPESRLENNWYWDNIGFAFEDKEIKNYNTNGYRVAVSPLPTEYSITRIWTGYYTDHWVWRNDFRPFYCFD